VETILIFHGKELCGKQLEIFSNFPETLDPDEYAKLLPRIESDEDIVMFDEMDNIREEKDWTESDQFQEIINSISEREG